MKRKINKTTVNRVRNYGKRLEKLRVEICSYLQNNCGAWSCWIDMPTPQALFDFANKLERELKK